MTNSTLDIGLEEHGLGACGVHRQIHRQKADGEVVVQPQCPA